MDCIYTVDLNPYGSSNGRSTLCSLSNKNILALGINEFICVLPLEKPNELIPIHKINNQCTQLCWNYEGTHLLSVHKDLTYCAYRIKNGLLNDFEIIGSFAPATGKIAVAKWLYKSPKFYFDWTKKDSLNFLEKYHQKTFNSLLNGGKYANNGFIVLDKNGKLYIHLIDLNSAKSGSEKLEYEILCEKFDIADFVYDDVDNIVVTCTKSDLFSPIYVYSIKLEITNDGLLRGNTELKSTFFLQTETKPGVKTHLVFCQDDQRNGIGVAVKSEQEDHMIQFWNYTPSPITPGTQYMNTSDQLFDFGLGGNESEAKTSEGTWAFVKALSCQSPLTGISVPKFPIKYEDLESDSSFFHCYLIATYEDGTVGYIDRVSYNQTITQSLNVLLETTTAANNVPRQKFLVKKPRIEQYITSIDQSLTGTIGVGVTNSNSIVLFRQTFLRETNPAVTSYFLNFFEYLMFSGNDYWDLLACMKQKLADGLIERFEESYLRQPLHSIQRAFFMRYNAILFSLYRQTTNGQAKSIDILTKLEINRCLSIISNTIQSVPSTEQNLGQAPNTSLLDLVDEALKYKNEPKTNLTDIVSQNIINRQKAKIIVNQQLRHLFQWIIDLSLYLVSTSTSTSNKREQQVTGSMLLNDAQFINEIRKCLIYMQILFLTAAQQQQQASSFIHSSLPVLPVRSSTTKDLISDLFNVYTKFFNKCNEKQSAIDEILQDQCIQIQSETLIKPMDELLTQLRQPWLGLNLAAKQCLKLNVEQQFHEEKINRREYPLFDIIRFIYFSRGQFTRQCTRCANYSEMVLALNSADENAKSNCNYILDSSSDKCICGGSWILAPIS